MKQLILLAGPPGSGKSTYCENNDYIDYFRISQDDQGKEGHMRYFLQLIAEGSDIIVDRMNFNKEQRSRYLSVAKANGYATKIVVLHESSATCLKRMAERKGHPTIQDDKSAKAALHTFMSKYERPTADEADEIEFVYPKGDKPYCIGVDLDGTLCNIEHRLHFVRGEGKKDWKSFLGNISGDSVNPWCESLINAYKHGSLAQIVYCSGRGSEYRDVTKNWLKENYLFWQCNEFDRIGTPIHENLYMRERGDHRADTVVKEILLDFEILTRFEPIFFVDDRPSVCRMWRSRGFKCLQIQEKEF